MISATVPAREPRPRRPVDHLPHVPPSRRHRSAVSGMTLVEILAVVMILGLLAVTLTVGITAKMGKAKQEICRTQIAQIMGQLQIWQMEQRSLPPANPGLDALSADAMASWYVEPAKLMDPWGAAYLYLTPGPDGLPFEILSYGADGQPGGTGDAADLSSAHLGQ